MVIRTLGPVIHVTSSRLIIVRLSNSTELPPLRCEVVDANSELIGHVIDIIGPVGSPYAVVKPMKLSVLSFIKPSTVLFYRYRKTRKAQRKPRRKQKRG